MIKKIRLLFLICAIWTFTIGCSEVQFSPIPKVEDAKELSDPVKEPSQVDPPNQPNIPAPPDVPDGNDHSTGDPAPPMDPPVDPPMPHLPPKVIYSQEHIQQGIKSKLDILVVVDNSLSMYEEQQKLAQRLDQFTNQLQDVDWQIGVTTTDVSNYKYGIKGDLLTNKHNPSGVITPEDANYKMVFNKTVVREETNSCWIDCPSSNEQPLKATQWAIAKSRTTTSLLFRDDADFAVLILSDEDEMSDAPIQATTPQQVITTFKDTFPSKKMSVYGVIIQPGDKSCYDSQEEGHYGTYVSQLANLTNGTTTSICNKDYSSGLAAIGKRALQLLNSFELEKDPVPASIVIKFNGVINLDWSVNGKTIILHHPPQQGTVIQIEYELQPTQPTI